MDFCEHLLLFAVNSLMPTGHNLGMLSPRHCQLCVFYDVPDLSVQCDLLPTSIIVELVVSEKLGMRPRL